MRQQSRLAIAAVLLAAGTLLAAGLVVSFGGQDTGSNEATNSDMPDMAEQPEIQQFDTEAAFREYIENGQQLNPVRTGQWQRTSVRVRETVDVEFDAQMDAGDGEAAPAPSGQSGGIDRIAESNVQVAGLDEPDVVKTDGEQFYYSPQPRWHAFTGPVVEPRPIEEPGFERDVQRQPQPREYDTHVINASEPADPTEIANVDASGQLLQTGDRLIVFEEHNQRIVAFDVSDPENPVEAWEQPLNDSLVTVREQDGQLYVVTQTRTGGIECPIQPMGAAHSIDCGDVYAPETQTSADATYSAFSIDSESGEIEDSISFVGTGRGTVVYMSANGLYVTYTTRASHVDMMTSYANESDAVPESLEERITEISNYNISDSSKQREIDMAIQAHVESLPEEDRQKTREAIRDGFQEYLGDHQLELIQTNVVNVDVADEELSVGDTGTVPGEPLNQFAVDEYEGTLRIATTIPRAGNADSINHLYVLDNETLDRESEITGMGEDQRVTSVRYEGDRAYVVTFRQIDPFYVIDFNEPTEPNLRGELELPGFSSYMHSIDDDAVIGIGQESGNVKAALFDVSEPTEPSVADDLILDEWSSEIDQTHHAFLIDRRHEVFFLPAGNSGYVVDYSDNELEVVAEVNANATVSRARYVNDYLYVFAGQEMIVLDQTDWERTATLDLGE